MANKAVRRRKNKRSQHKYALIFLACAAAVLLAVLISRPDGDTYMHSSAVSEEIMQGSPLLTEEKLDPRTASVMLDSQLYSGYAYLCNAENASVIAEKNCEARFYPASLTKIMTTLVLIENAEDLYAQATVSADMYNELYKAGASLAGFSAGERVRLYDLLCGIMLPSGAEAAIAAAEYVAGSEEKLVAMMNSKALEMGLSNTHFANITGLHDDDHYTNAAEMATILSAALENEVFREISSKQSHTVPPTNKHPKGFTMSSTVFKKLGGKQPESHTIIGGKTGFTYEAGLCLATYAEYDGELYIAVTMGAEGNHKTPQHQVDDAIYLYDLAA